jgi:hypothetical protein
MRCMWRNHSAVMLACVLAGCGARYSSAVDRQHAALYGCNARDVRVTSVGRRTYAAEGCGHRAIYICRRGAVCAQEGEPQATGPARERRPHAVPDALQSAEDAAVEQARARVRASPRAPEVGGLWHEAEMLCTSQSAAFLTYMRGDGSGALSCELAGHRLFAAHVSAERRRIDEVDVYLEGADVPALRERYTGEFGPALERLDSAGRSWTWETDARQIVLRMYERGARVTVREAGAGSHSP